MGRPFGWDLPPGVTARMIDEQALGQEPSKEAEAWLEIFEPAVDCLRDGVLKVETLESLQTATVELIEKLVEQRERLRDLEWYRGAFDRLRNKLAEVLDEANSADQP